MAAELFERVARWARPTFLYVLETCRIPWRGIGLRGKFEQPLLRLGVLQHGLCLAINRQNDRGREFS